MIEVLNDYSEPVIPPGFPRALELIDPKLSVLWHGGAKRWLILTENVPRSVFKDGYVVEHIVSKNEEFAPLNEDVLNFLREARWERDNEFARKFHAASLDHHLQEVDQENQKKIDAAEKNRLDGFQQAGKKAHKFRTTKTFI